MGCSSAKHIRCFVSVLSLLAVASLLLQELEQLRVNNQALQKENWYLKAAETGLLGLYILVGALGVPFWALLSQRFDKRRGLVLATLIQAVALLVAFMGVGKGSMAVYSGCIIVAGISFGGVPVIRFSMLGDVADLLQLQSAGRKDEGKLVAVFDISSKLAASALISLGFTVIDLSGYKADEPQGPSATLAIRIFYGLVPAVLGGFSALVVFVLYPLDRAKHAEVLSQLDVNPETLGKPSDESLYFRRRRERRKRRFGRGDDREDRFQPKLSKLQVSTELELFDDFLHNRSPNPRLVLQLA
eukprot:s384_g21.t1